MKLSKTKIKISEAANELFYQQGFEHTSFSQIANKVGISRGNFYHHYKTKDDILGAVISLRLLVISELIEAWEDKYKEPEARIRAFIHSSLESKEATKVFGCPIGSLCSELNKLDHPAKSEAAGMFTRFRHWLTTQFQVLGFDQDADHYAMHLMTQNQGAAVLASTLGDSAIITAQSERMDAWLTELLSNKH